MESNPAHKPDPENGNSSELERWKILLDLNMKSWANSYNDLPNQLKDRGYRLITLYTATLVALPSAVSKVLETETALVEANQNFAAMSLASLGMVAIFFIVFAIKEVVNACLRTRPFAMFSCPDLRQHVEDGHDTVMFHRIVVKHFEEISTDNISLASEIAQSTTRSLNYYYIALGLGFCLYMICQITLATQ